VYRRNIASDLAAFNGSRQVWLPSPASAWVCGQGQTIGFWRFLFQGHCPSFGELIWDGSGSWLYILARWAKAAFRLEIGRTSIFRKRPKSESICGVSCRPCAFSGHCNCPRSLAAERLRIGKVSADYRVAASDNGFGLSISIMRRP
jgi:hypothetical protein